MNAAPRLALAAICAAALAATAAEKRPFDLYQGIIDCQPFGPPPDDPSVDPSSISRADAKKAAATDEEKAAEKQQEELEKAVSVSVLNIAPDGRVMVGFTDATAKPAANFYLAVGDARGGWTVKEADPVEKSVVLEKDGVEIERTVGNGAGKGTAKAKAAAPEKRKSDLLVRGGGASLRSRRAQKEAEREAEAEERRAMREEIKRRQEEEEARRAEDRARAEEDRAAMREDLLNIQEQLRQNRELKRLREQRESEGGDDGQTEEEGEGE